MWIVPTVPPIQSCWRVRPRSSHTHTATLQSETERGSEWERVFQKSLTVDWTLTLTKPNTILGESESHLLDVSLLLTHSSLLLLDVGWRVHIPPLVDREPLPFLQGIKNWQGRKRCVHIDSNNIMLHATDDRWLVTTKASMLHQTKNNFIFESSLSWKNSVNVDSLDSV